MKKLLFAIVAAVGLNTAQADTFQYQATTDFSDLTAGEVPYYVHRRVAALAIDAGNPAYRDKFARASTTFDGPAALYDVTIDALGEEDGECEFRFLVNGVVVGSAVNTRVGKDYDVQNHVFNNISIPANAEISVESNAVSNGLIPEDDIFAFARGRWTALTLVSDPDSLAISIDTDDDTPQVGQSVEIIVDIFNEDPQQIATTPVLQLTLPDQLTADSHPQCTAANNVLSCALAEITPKETRTFTVTATAIAGGTAQLLASVTSDQQTIAVTDNSYALQIDSPAPEVTTDTTVDLGVTISSDVATAVVGDTVNYELTIVNQHQTNTATSPVASILLPDGLSFSASSICTPVNRTITCELAELTAQESTTVDFSAKVNTPGNAIVIASVSAAQSEDTIGDNEVLYSITTSTDSGDNTAVEPDRNSNTNSPDNTAQTSGGNGGGTTSLPVLSGLLLIAAFTRRRITNV